MKNLLDTTLLHSYEKFYDENLKIIKNLLMLYNRPQNFIDKHIKSKIFNLKNKEKNPNSILNNKDREIDYKCLVFIYSLANQLNVRDYMEQNLEFYIILLYKNISQNILQQCH